MLCEEAIRTYRICGDRKRIAFVLGNLGSIAGHLNNHAAARAACGAGEYDRAGPLFTEALRVRQTPDDHRGISFSLRGLAEVRLHQGGGHDAVVLFAASEALRERLTFVLSQTDQARFNAKLNVARNALSKIGEAAFADAWAEGNKLTSAEAASLALNKHP